MIGVMFKFPKLGMRLLRGRAVVDREIIIAVQTNRGRLFSAAGDFNGHKKWPTDVFRAGQPLSNRGTLKKSFFPGGKSGNPGPGGFVKRPGIVKVGDIIVGTKLAYAGLMNWGTTKLPGGVLRAKNGVLAIPLPAGKKATDVAKELRKTARKVMNPRTEKNERVIFRKSVKIPARRFDDTTSADEKEFRAAAKNAVAKVLRG